MTTTIITNQPAGDAAVSRLWWPAPRDVLTDRCDQCAARAASALCDGCAADFEARAATPECGAASSNSRPTTALPTSDSDSRPLAAFPAESGLPVPVVDVRVRR